jgi:hypothetical protein
MPVVKQAGAPASMYATAASGTMAARRRVGVPQLVGEGPRWAMVGLPMSARPRSAKLSTVDDDVGRRVLEHPARVLGNVAQGAVQLEIVGTRKNC